MSDTNLFDVLAITVTLMTYLAAFAGTAYLIEWRGWSPWWLLFTLVAFSSIKVSTGH